MEQSSHHIAHLLCSRLCHELIGPLGALIGGFDMFREFGDDFTSEERQTLFDSSDRLAARIKFYRLAYGSAGSRLYAPQDILPLLRALLTEHRIICTLPDDEHFQNTQAGALWLMSNLAILAIDILKNDASVHCQMKAGDLTSLEMDFVGDEAKLDETLHHALSGTIADDDLSAYNVHGVHNYQIAQQLGYQLIIREEDRKVSLSLQKI